MALQIRGNTQIMQASVSLDRLDSNGGNIYGSVSINSLSSSNATITGGSATGLSSVSSVAGSFSGALSHTGDSAGVKFSSLYADIDGGTIDGTDITVGANKTLDVSAGDLVLANDQISGDKINGGTIDSVGILSVDIDGGTIDNTSYTAGTGSVDLSGLSTSSGLTIDNDAISGDKISGGSLSSIAVDGSLDLSSLDSSGALTINNDMISGNAIHGGDISGDLDLSGSLVRVTSGDMKVVSGDMEVTAGDMEVSAGKFTAGGGNFIVDSSGNATMQNLTVNGTTTTVNAETVAIADNHMLLNSNLDSSTAPSESAGIEINRGSSSNVKFEWDETNDRWSLGAQKLYSSEKFMASGFQGDLLSSSDAILIDNTNEEAYLDIKDSAGGSIILNHETGALAGNASTSSKWQSARSFSFDSSGDIFGVAQSVDGSADVEFKLDIQSNSLEFSMINSGSILSADSASDTVWDSAADNKLVSAKDIKEYVDNKTSSSLSSSFSANSLSFKIGNATNDGMVNVKYQIEDHLVDSTEAGSEYVDLAVAVNSSYQTLSDVYMNGQKLRYGAAKDYYFDSNGSGSFSRIKFVNIDLEAGDVVEAKYLISE